MRLYVLVPHEGCAAGKDEEDDEWEKFAMRVLAAVASGALYMERTYKKADVGGGGGTGVDERPQAMFRAEK
jgi:hypothetical protein